METADNPFYVQNTVLFSDVGGTDVTTHQDEILMHQILLSYKKYLLCEIWVVISAFGNLTLAGLWENESTTLCNPTPKIKIYKCQSLLGKKDL